MEKLKVLDLFSGIGGFSLGLERAGMETVAFCEIDPYCQKILKKHWPNTPIYPDIKKIKGSDFENVDILCGGFPCQPYSNAGKQKAEKDDRDLWPEMFRVIKEVRPRWVIGENVAGFINLGMPRTKTDLESIGYTLLPFEIPACALGARHGRNRVWIVAHSNGPELRDKSGGRGRKGWEGENAPSSFSALWDVTDFDSEGFRDQTNAAQEENNKRIRQGDGGTKTAPDLCARWTSESGVVRVIHGISPGLDRDGEERRKQRVAALGNTVIPQIPELIGRAILEIEGAQ